MDVYLTHKEREELRRNYLDASRKAQRWLSLYFSKHFRIRTKEDHKTYVAFTFEEENWKVKRSWHNRYTIILPWDKHRLQRMRGEIPLGNYGIYLSILGFKGGVMIRYYNNNGSVKDVKRIYFRERRIGY